MVEGILTRYTIKTVIGHSAAAIFLSVFRLVANSCRYGEYPLTSQIREFPPVLGRDATVLIITAILPKDGHYRSSHMSKGG